MSIGFNLKNDEEKFYDKMVDKFESITKIKYDGDLSNMAKLIKHSFEGGGMSLKDEKELSNLLRQIEE